MASEWNASRTSRNTLHVINSRTGVHFEADDEQTVNDTIAAINAAEQEAAKPVEVLDPASVSMPVGDPVVRAN